MDRLRKYVISNLSSYFSSIFISLFAIASVVFLVKIATYTAVIEVSVTELLELFVFMLPEVLFYTLPVTFFIAATLALFKISNDNEIIVLFSLGIKPSFLLKILFKPALLLTITLLFDFLVIFPHAKVLSANMLTYKRSEAKFNLAASEFGNSFGDWLLYLGKDNKDGSYSKVFLFNKRAPKEILIEAKKAKILNNGGLLKLQLLKGEGYTYSKTDLSQINFESMIINDTLKTDLDTYRKPLDYWRSPERAKAKKKMLIRNTLLSFFPILSLFMVAAIGIVQVRYQKSKVYLYMFLSILIYYASSLSLHNKLGYYAVPIVMVLWSVVTYFIYRKTIAKRY